MKRAIVLVALLLSLSAAVVSQTTEFTYQGTLKDNGNPANASYDFEFALFDASSGGNQVGSTIPKSNMLVTNGVFAVKLDFGSVFPGGSRYLEIRVRQTGQPTFTTLSRQMINSSPYSAKSLSADNATNAVNASTATNATQLGGVAAGQYVLTTDPRMTDARSPVSGSDNYIQNRTTPQGGNFNVGGDGTVGGNLSGNILNAILQFNIGGSRVLSVGGSESLSIGVGAGSSNQSFQNTFVGAGAGLRNSFGSNNAFFGRDAGTFNVTGNNNVFIGPNAGFANSNGSDNSFFGDGAGSSNVSGGANVFIGAGAAARNSSANFNTFVGFQTGFLNSTGTRNTLIGAQASVASADLTNVTAIGSRALVSQNNSIILGSINGVNQATADTNVGIGTTAPATKLHVSGGDGVRIRVNSTGNGGLALTLNDQPGWSVATVTGGQFQIFNDGIGSNAVWIDPTTNNFGLGTNSPSDKLDVNGSIRFSSLGSAGSTSLCRNSLNQISSCSSSLRYKTNIAPFSSGLDLVRGLMPITFSWKSDAKPDLGLGAEDVAKIEPLLVTHNEKGEVEGVKYDRVTLVLINAVKEQQTQIEALQKMISNQQSQIDHLRTQVRRGRRQ